MMRRQSLCSARLFLLAFLLHAFPAGAATILEESVRLEIEPGGDVVESTTLRVRLDSNEDLEDWENYPVALDANRELLTLDARVVHADGSSSKVKRKRDRDTMEVSSGATFYGSRSYEVITFPELRHGSTLEIEHTVRESPYHPSGVVQLRRDEPIERLRVEVRRKGISTAPEAEAGKALHWRIDGPREDLEIAETADGLVITGNNLAAVELPDAAPGGGLPYGVLRFAWGGGDWNAVGRWYDDLLAAVPRGDDAVRAQARELLTEVGDDPRERLEALLAFLRRKVRYVAVEVGIGGYRPTPAAETLERGWGDCKDKSILLLDLLEEAGIPGHPALILSSDSARIDPELPTPYQFNHLIVAVPASAVRLEDGDPVRDGYLFLDPTQTRGGAGWLHPGVQDQHSLVVEQDGGRLVETPFLPSHEKLRLEVDLAVDANGNAEGEAVLRLGGEIAASFVTLLETEPEERKEELARSTLIRLLPGVALDAPTWTTRDGAVPTVELRAATRLDGLVQGLDTAAPSFPLEGLRAMPGVELLEGDTEDDERELPVVLSPRRVEETWRFSVPEGWCQPREGERVAENPLGSFRQAVARGEDGGFTVERTSALHTRWAEPDELPKLRELAVAEHRAHRRRIRLRCE